MEEKRTLNLFDPLRWQKSRIRTEEAILNPSGHWCFRIQESQKQCASEETIAIRPRRAKEEILCRDSFEENPLLPNRKANMGTRLPQAGRFSESFILKRIMMPQQAILSDKASNRSRNNSNENCCFFSPIPTLLRQREWSSDSIGGTASFTSIACH